MNRIILDLIEYDTINDRICKTGVNGRFTNVTILSVYTQLRTGRKQRNRDCMTNFMRSVVSLTGMIGMLVVGKGRIPKTGSLTVSLHNENSNGNMLVGFAMKKNLFIKNTSFQKFIKESIWERKKYLELTIPTKLTTYWYQEYIFLQCQMPEAVETLLMVVTIVRAKIREKVAKIQRLIR